MVMDLSQQHSATDASLAAAHQGITEAAARERELVDQLQKADAVHLSHSPQILELLCMDAQLQQRPQCTTWDPMHPYWNTTQLHEELESLCSTGTRASNALSR